MRERQAREWRRGLSETELVRAGAHNSRSGSRLAASIGLPEHALDLLRWLVGETLRVLGLRVFSLICLSSCLALRLRAEVPDFAGADREDPTGSVSVTSHRGVAADSTLDLKHEEDTLLAGIPSGTPQPGSQSG